MATYTNISADEMREFLTERGFAEIKVKGTLETVYGCRMPNAANIPLCCRVYTGITGSDSRGCGDDAIRVSIWTMTPEGKPVMVAGYKRVNRVETWRTNLQERLTKALAFSPERICPTHKLPLCERKAKRKPAGGAMVERRFFGCPIWPGCSYTEPY
jgi:hypothetical protein